MTLWHVAAKNALRNKIRTAMTVAGVAVAIVAFVLLRTVVFSWNAAAEYAAKDRLSTRHKVSFGLPLPKRYLDDIVAHVPGVRSATYCDWFGGRWVKDPSEFFANMACADNAFEVYPEITVDPAALARWKNDKQGAIVGDMLAKKLGFHVGDRVTLEGTFYPGDWDFTIVGIYSAPPQSAVDRSSFMFRWDYKNDGVPEAQRDRIGWIFTRVDDPSKSAVVGRAIDALFDERDVQTITMSERAANNSVLGAVTAVLAAIDVASVIVLVILALVLANTIAMGVRERATEFGVLRAIGFGPRKIRALIVGEAMAISFAAAVIGLLVAYPIVDYGVGRILVENMGKFFPVFRVTLSTAGAAFALTLLLGVLASGVPALRAGRISVTDALRRVA